MTADAFDKFWNEPHPETGTTWADIYGQPGMARMVWLASRAQALTEAAALCVSSNGRDYGMTGRNCADQITKLRDEA